MDNYIGNVTLPVKEYIEKLEYELNVCKEECNNLKQEIKNILLENKEISNNIEDKFNLNFQHTFYENDFINNLKSQLLFINKEKDYAVDLWQVASKEVDKLEYQLHVLQQKFDILSKEEKEKTLYSEELKENSSVRIQYDNLMKNYNESVKKITLLENKIIDLEKNVQIHQCDKKYQNILMSYQVSIDELQKQNEKLTQKLQMEILEKNAAVLKETYSKEEVCSLKNVLSNLIKETDNRIIHETNYIKEKYNEKVNFLIEDMKLLKLENEETNRKLANAQSAINDMEHNSNNIPHKSETRIINLQKRLSETIEKLVITERENNQLSSEYENIKLDLSAMMRGYDTNIKTMLSDSKQLKNRIRFLENELNVTLDTLHRTISESDELSLQLQLIQLDVRKKKENEQILQDLFEKCTSSDKENEEINENLKSQLKAIQELNERWKNELNEITEKVNIKIKFYKNEIVKLRKMNNT